MKKYVCKNDIIFMGTKLASVGDIVEEGSILKADNDFITLRLEPPFIENVHLFQELKDLDLEIKEAGQSDEDLVKDWVIQMKVNTSRRKLREIEDFLRKNVEKFL